MRSLLNQKAWEEIQKHKSEVKAGDYKFIESISIGDMLLANAILELLISAKVDVTRNLTVIPSGWFAGSAFIPTLWKKQGVNINSILSNRKIREVEDSCFWSIQNIGSGVLVIEGHINTIGSYSFSYLKGVSRVEFEEGLGEIGSVCFHGCRLDGTDIILPNSIERLGGYCFQNSQVHSIYIPQSVKMIDGNVGDETTVIKYGGSRDELAETLAVTTTLGIDKFEQYHHGNVIYNSQS